MPQYVVHKIGFFYNDDAYEINEPKGNVMGVFSSLDEAKLWKGWEDIEVMKWMAGFGYPVYRFYREKTNRVAIYENIEEYCKAEFGHVYEDYRLPRKINDEQATQFLSIMELTFHTIVEYGDDEVIDPAVFKLNEDNLAW